MTICIAVNNLVLFDKFLMTGCYLPHRGLFVIRQTTIGTIASIGMAAAVKTYEFVTGVAHVEVPIRRTLYPDDKGAFTFFRRDLETAPHLPLAVLAYVGHFDVGSLVNLLRPLCSFAASE